MLAECPDLHQTRQGPDIKWVGEPDYIRRVLCRFCLQVIQVGQMLNWKPLACKSELGMDSFLGSVTQEKQLFI